MNILESAIRVKSKIIPYLHSPLVQVVFVGFIAILCLASFQLIVAGNDVAPVQFLHLSSDSMMQTIPIVQLRENPIESLYYLHIQPPLLDVIRTLIVTFFVDQRIVDEAVLIQAVDGILQHLYVTLFGILSALIFLWIRLATNSVLFAGVVTVGWSVYPTPIFLSTLLDGTLLSAVLITWMIFEIWLMYQGRGSASRLALSILLCFFVRSFFQWYFLPALLVSLILIGMKGRKLTIVCLLLVLGAGGYLGKQYLVFGIPSTSTFSGEHLTGVLWIEEANPAGGLVWTGKETEAYREMINTREKKISLHYPAGAHDYAAGYNTEQQWKLNLIHSEIALEKCVSSGVSCLTALWKSLRQNWSEYWHVEGWGNSVLVDRLPDWYKRAYFRLSTRYVWFLVFAAALFLIAHKISRKSEWRKILGLILVPGFVFGVCIFGNRFDWYEGGRMKFFLEPVYVVFVSSQIYLFGTQLLWKPKRLVSKFKM